MNKKLLLFFAFICIITINITNAQNNIRDKFLVESIWVSTSTCWYLTEYSYDANNKLLKRVATGAIQEFDHFRPMRDVNVFEYENGRVSKIIRKDSTHFMFNYDTHFFYNSQGQLIRSEQYMYGNITFHENYHYENGKMVSVYYDGEKPFDYGRIFYDNKGNVTMCTHFITGTGNPFWRTHYYEYDNYPKPNFGIDYLFAYQPLVGQGSIVNLEMGLSKNNMTKMVEELHTLNYTYNEHCLPDSYEIIFDPDTPLEPFIFHITYKQVEVGITEPNQEFSEVKVYPNPTTGEFRVLSFESRVEDIEIYDVFGRKVFKQKAESRKQNVIDISHLQTGIYFIKITTDNGAVVKKVVKQ